MKAAQKKLPNSHREAALRQVPVRRWKNGAWEHFADSVSPEVPVRVLWAAGNDKADKEALLWAWPDDLETLCLGHVLLEGGDASALPQGLACACRQKDEAEMTFSVSPVRPPWLAPEPPKTRPTLRNLAPEALLRHMEAFLRMPGSCPSLWDDTGCFHRAGLLDLASGSILRLAEDIGRHNCLDRLAGWACLNKIDTRSHALLLSARITASLYTKARRAGFSFLISRSAVTTAAVRRAQAEGVSLVGFCRPGEGRFTVFAEPADIEGATGAGTGAGTGANTGADVLGVVLAGGLSTRLGQDKVHLSLPGRFPQGQDMLGSTLELLRTCTSEVAVSCRTSRDVSPWRRIPDLIENLGPLGGMYSVIKAEARPVLVLSCDLPFMSEDILQKLLAARAARPPEAVMTTFRQAETGFIEALVAVYEPACLPWFEAALAKGIRQLNLVVPEKLRYDVVYSREEALPFFNINYPADLEAARRLVTSS